MDLPTNAFKKAILTAKQPQIGLWCSLPGAYIAELLAGAGYDWLLIDTEHSPGDPITIVEQLQAIAAYRTSAVVRPAANDPVIIKRVLDTGAQSLLIPFVQNDQEARDAVRATRYPPDGIRGVAGMTRATRFGRVADYARRAADELCVLVQVESREALGEIEAIAAVPGVDGIFIGPADLAASIGHAGQPGHPENVALIENAIKRIRAAGKPAGILTPDVAFAKRCIDLGVVFAAVGVDAALLARGSEGLLEKFQAT